MAPRERVAASLGSESSVAEEANNAVSLTNIRSSVWQGPLSLLRDSRKNGLLQNKKKAVLALVLLVLCAAVIAFVALYSFHRGFRRTCQFWSRTLPWVAEYHWIKFYAHNIKKCNETEWEQISQEFHKTTAFKAVRMVEQMGGIYVKMGQALSTMGSGIMPEEYVQALRPLQDGVPPRSYETIAAIIEQSTGRKMDDVFDDFERKPVGAATIAQAHKAVLKQGPQSTSMPNDVAAELNNKHSHDDHAHLKQKKNKRCPPQNKNDHSTGSNLQGQVIVKIQYPDVAELFDADLNNLELLVKLFLPTKSRDLIKNLRERHERELDFRQEADHLEECSRNMRKHGLEPSWVRIPRVRNETGLCTKNVLVMEYLHGISLRSVMEHEQDRIARALGKDSGEELRLMIAKRIREHFEKGGGEAKGGNLLAGGERKSKMNVARLWNVLGPLAMHGLRHYARMREQLVHLVSGATNILHLPSPEKAKDQVGNNNHQPPTNQHTRPSRAGHVNLGKILKTMIAAHGIQVMRDGVYNLDPHPGNVLVLEDGRVGLLDYGMVGRLSQEDKLKVAATIVGLAQHNRTAIAQLYLDSGYHINWENATMVTDPNLLFRVATWHFDKIDFTPITLSDGTQVDALELLDSLDLIYVPDWMIQARRVSRLMMGVCAQAARPISLAKEWERIAKQVLKESKTQLEQERRRTA